MTWTRWTPGGRLSPSDPRPPDAPDALTAVDGQPNGSLFTAFLLGAVAAVLLAVGSSVPVVAGASPGYRSAPLLVVLAVAPMVLVALFALRGRLTAAVGVLAGVAALAPGRLVLDLQFLVDPSAAARPELYRPEVFELPGAGVGLWLLLAGHLAAIAAGVVGVRAVASRSDSSAEERGLLLAVGVVAAGIAAIGVMMAPFSTADAFLPVGSAFESPALVLAGCLLLAFALPVATGFAISSGTGGITTGGLLGVAVAAAAVALPNLVSGLAVRGVVLTAGPIVVLVGAVGLAAAGLATVAFLPLDRQATDAADRGAAEAPDDEAGVASLPGSTRLRTATGTLGLLTMLAALAGALTTQVTVAGGLPGLQSPSRWLLLVAGLLVGVLSAMMFVPRLAATVRPVLSVCWAGVPLAATAVLTTAITASELGAGLTPGPGVLWTAVAAAGAVATACCSVVAGMVERDDSEDNEDAEAMVDLQGAGIYTPVVAGGILALGAFGTPSIVAPDYVEPALWSNFGTPSWGLLLALLTLLGACSLAPRCRPVRATALLIGTTLLAVLRVLELPLAAGQIGGAHAGAGWWLALGCAVALAIASGMASRGVFHSPDTRSGSIR